MKSYRVIIKYLIVGMLSKTIQKKNSRCWVQALFYSLISNLHLLLFRTQPVDTLILLELNLLESKHKLIHLVV